MTIDRRHQIQIALVIVECFLWNYLPPFVLVNSIFGFINTNDITYFDKIENDWHYKMYMFYTFDVIYLLLLILSEVRSACFIFRFVILISKCVCFFFQVSGQFFWQLKEWWLNVFRIPIKRLGIEHGCYFFGKFVFGIFLRLPIQEIILKKLL